jgi:flagellar P-ring protein FlgI
MTKNRTAVWLLIAALLVLGGPPAASQQGQAQDKGQNLTKEQLAEIDRLIQERQKEQTDRVRKAEDEGIEVRLGDIGRFRGSRSNVITGIGLVVGLAGTGDSKATPWTTTLISNYLSRWGTAVDEKQVRARNIAAVMVTAELPAFVAPGTKIDVTVSSSGDAKSLEGGVLLPATLSGMSEPDVTMAVAMGPISIGGFNASSGGSSVRKNHPNVGLVASGGIVERSVPTQFLFTGNVMYFDLDEPDFTTAERTAQALREAFPDVQAVAEDGATIRLTLPEGLAPTLVAQQVEGAKVFANVPATIVVNERTGTIVVGGNVKIGPAIVAHGSLQVRIVTDFVVSQPAPFSQGQTVVVAIPDVEAQEDPAQMRLIAPNATLDDLARVFQTLRLSARDVIAILMALKDQGALKARIKLQ